MILHETFINDTVIINVESEHFSVIETVELFNHPSSELKEALKYQLKSFDPDDSYWKVTIDYHSTFYIAPVHCLIIRDVTAQPIS